MAACRQFISYLNTWKINVAIRLFYTYTNIMVLQLCFNGALPEIAQPPPRLSADAAQAAVLHLIGAEHSTTGCVEGTQVGCQGREGTGNKPGTRRFPPVSSNTTCQVHLDLFPQGDRERGRKRKKKKRGLRISSAPPVVMHNSLSLWATDLCLVWFFFRRKYRNVTD